MQGKHGHLSREQKQLALRLHAKGWRLVDIAREIGCSAPMVGIMARTGAHLDAKPFGWEPRSGQLSIQEREQILLGLNRGRPSRRSPASWVGRCPPSAERSRGAAAELATRPGVRMNVPGSRLADPSRSNSILGACSRRSPAG